MCRQDTDTLPHPPKNVHVLILEIWECFLAEQKSMITLGTLRCRDHPKLSEKAHLITKSLRESQTNESEDGQLLACRFPLKAGKERFSIYS